MARVLIFTCLISCKEGERQSVQSPPSSTDSKAHEMLTLDELGMKIQKEQKGEVVIPESKLIYKMEYYEHGGHLILYFQRNPEKTYLYKDVPVEVWENFKSAESKGRFFGEKISNIESYKVIR